MLNIGDEVSGVVVGVTGDYLEVLSMGKVHRVLKQFAGIPRSGSLEDGFLFNDSVVLRVSRIAASGRPLFMTAPCVHKFRPVDAPTVLVDGSNVARFGEKDPKRKCFRGAGLFAAAYSLMAIYYPEIVRDGNHDYVLNDDISQRSTAVLRRWRLKGLVGMDTVSGYEADEEILKRCEESGFTKRVLSNDLFLWRKDRHGNIIGRWSDLFPWLNDDDLYQRVFVRYEFTGGKFKCDELGIATEVREDIFN